MRNGLRLLGGALILSVFFTAPSPAEAVPGGTLESAIKVARAQKRDVMGVTYYLKGNTVVGESWSSEMAGWTDAAADRFRAMLVGKKKLKSKQVNERVAVFLYTDGTQVQYNKRRGKVITLDIAGPTFTAKDLAAGKYRQVDDWKQKPWKNKPW